MSHLMSQSINLYNQLAKNKLFSKSVNFDLKRIKLVLQKLIKGQDVSMENSDLSKREWNELMEAFGLKNKIIS